MSYKQKKDNVLRYLKKDPEDIKQPNRDIHGHSTSFKSDVRKELETYYWNHQKDVDFRAIKQIHRAQMLFESNHWPGNNALLIAETFLCFKGKTITRPNNSKRLSL